MTTQAVAPVTHIVRRAMNGMRPGQCVDTKNWRWAGKLEEQNRIVPIPATVTPVQAEDGTWWEDERLAAAQDARNGKKPSAEPSGESEGASSGEALAGEYPVKIKRGQYRLSDGTVVKGSKATAEQAEAELHEGDDDS